MLKHNIIQFWNLIEIIIIINNYSRVEHIFIVMRIIILQFTYYNMYTLKLIAVGFPILKQT